MTTPLQQITKLHTDAIRILEDHRIEAIQEINESVDKMILHVNLRTRTRLQLHGYGDFSCSAPSNHHSPHTHHSKG